MRILFILILFCGTNTVYGQNVINVDKQSETVDNSIFYNSGGVPFVNAKYVRLVEGTPYFKDAWLKASLLTTKDQLCKNIPVKLDLVDNDIHYLDKDGNEMVSISSFKEMVLHDSISNISYHFTFFSKNIQGYRKGWYQVLYSGNKISLFKYYNKNVIESSPYGSATAEQHIFTSDNYFIFFNDKITTIKKEKDILYAFKDKEKELNQLLKDHKFSSTEEKFTALVQYFDSH
jgi:hypothetical protein